MPNHTKSNLAGKRALVTGGAQRLGRAIALGLGGAGMDVAVHYRSSRDDAERTAVELAEGGGRAVCLQADLARRPEARHLVDEAASALGGLDLLVVSAASFEPVGFDQVDDDTWDRTLELNLGASFALAQQAAPWLRRARGSVVFLTCASATVPFRGYLPYVVSKGALRHLMRTLALELAPEVRVNAVAPGTVLPPPGMDPEHLQRIVGRVPLGRVGDAEDIVRAVLYLAASEFVTGTELVVDGGRTVAAFERFG